MCIYIILLKIYDASCIFYCTCKSILFNKCQIIYNGILRENILKMVMGIQHHYQQYPVEVTGVHRENVRPLAHL